MRHTLQQIFGALLLTAILSGGAFAQTGNAPDQAAKNFYRWYLTALNNGKNPLKQEKPKMLRAVSRRLGKWIYSKAYEAYGADYFIDAQDFEKDWANNIDTSNVAIQGGKAIFNVNLLSPSGGMGTRILHITMVRENGVWKIDEVLGINE